MVSTTDSERENAKAARKYVITEYICLEGPKEVTVKPKLRNNRVRYNRSIFIRVCVSLLPGPATMVRYIRRYAITEYVITGLCCINRGHKNSVKIHYLNPTICNILKIIGNMSMTFTTNLNIIK